jgi:RNA polymerase sigma-70 factor (ECF subfamily)
MFGKKLGLRWHAVLVAVLAAVLLAVPAMAGSAATVFISQQQETVAPVDRKALGTVLQQALASYLETDSSQRDWKVTRQEINPVSLEVNGAQITGIFDVHRQFLLAYATPDEAPVIKGKLRWLKENRVSLAPAQIKAAENEIAMWRSDLAEYISKPQNCWERLNVTAVVAGGRVANFKVFGEDPVGGYVLLQRVVPTSNQVEQGAYSGMTKLLSLARPDYPVISSTVLPQSLYNRLTARDYPNRWTSNTTKPCRPGSTTTQDSSYYNNAEYCWYQCNDCANYVSQALHAGGIPMDSTWWGNKSSTSYTWRNVTPLRNYMLNTKKYWQVVGRWECVAGYPFRMTSYEHIMMMVYNDGKSQLYSAHTSDQKQKAWYGGSSVEYFKVIY